MRRRLDLDEARLRKMVLAYPSLLGYSVEDNMAPKLEFLAREIGLSHAELREWVVRNPSTLGLSLANRYRSRIEACRATGVDARRVLSYATQTDEAFCKRTGIAPEALVAARESVLSVTAAASRARPPVAARSDGRLALGLRRPLETRRTCATCCGRGSR